MAQTTPGSLPPPELHDRLLAALLPQLHLPNPVALRTVLQILAYQSLHSTTNTGAHSVPTRPLQLALQLSSSPPPASENLDLETLVDLVCAYPNHHNAISAILTRRFDADPTILDRLTSEVLPTLTEALRGDAGQVGVKAISTLLHAHDEILSSVVMDPLSLLAALQSLYGKLDLSTKEDVLLLVKKVLAGAKESAKEMMGVRSGRAFEDGSLRTDYDAIFNSGSGGADGEPLSDDVLAKLRRTQEGKNKANVSTTAYTCHLADTSIGATRTS